MHNLLALRHADNSARAKFIDACKFTQQMPGIDIAKQVGMDSNLRRETLRRAADDEAGNGRIRRIIDYLILIDGDLHQGLKENS